MKVYVLEGLVAYEGSQVIGIYEDKELADVHAESVEGNWDGTSVTEHELKENDKAKHQREKVKRILGRDNTLQLGC